MGNLTLPPLLLLCRLTTAFLSTFLDNVTTSLLMAPVTISLMRQCNTDPVPLLLSQVRTQSISTFWQDRLRGRVQCNG
jgi:Na+/H+ antiporter NhaD/arsenite permease-like protein